MVYDTQWAILFCYVAQDQTLRRSIRKIVKVRKFLESIGIAQMEQELQKRVLTVAKENADVMKETGVNPSLTKDEMKEYLDIVLNEIRRQSTVFKLPPLLSLLKRQ
jgi:hypothetical protein